MSKLEDKLSASLKPARSKPTPVAKPASRPTTKDRAPVPREQAPAPAGDKDDVTRPLHPRRVWPD
jgi:hypothetical protein